MDEITILHFTEINEKSRRPGRPEYLVMLEDADVDSDTYCEAGYRLKGIHRSDVDAALLLPLGVPLWREL
jgi:hypothetical protein